MPVKHYKPTDPEFHAIASTVTPLNRIRKDHFGKRTYIDQDESRDRMANKPRRENVDKHRG